MQQNSHWVGKHFHFHALKKRLSNPLVVALCSIQHILSIDLSYQCQLTV